MSIIPTTVVARGLQGVRSIGSALGAGLLVAAGCTQVEKLPLGVDGGGGVPVAVQRVFDTQCASPACHGGANFPDLSAGNSASIIGGESKQNSPMLLVDPGNVEGSYMAAKLLPNLPHSNDAMPPPGGVMNAEALPEDIAVVVGWIAGADLPDEGVGMDGTEDAMDDGPAVVECSANALSPGVNTGVDAGAAMGQLPVEIGAVLEGNCGCHYVDSGVAPFAATPTDVTFATHAQFQTQYTGASARYAGLDHWEIVEIRVIVDENMPTFSCQVASGDTISQGDKETLRRWLEADAPDAPTWAGMGG